MYEIFINKIKNYILFEYSSNFSLKAAEDKLFKLNCNSLSLSSLCKILLIFMSMFWAIVVNVLFASITAI